MFFSDFKTQVKFYLKKLQHPIMEPILVQLHVVRNRSVALRPVDYYIVQVLAGGGKNFGIKYHK